MVVSRLQSANVCLTSPIAKVWSKFAGGFHLLSPRAVSRDMRISRGVGPTTVSSRGLAKSNLLLLTIKLKANAPLLCALPINALYLR